MLKYPETLKYDSIYIIKFAETQKRLFYQKFILKIYTHFILIQLGNLL